MDHINIFVAFAAGLLSFLSPCVFPLIPAYVSHITGAWVEKGKMEIGRRLLIMRSLGFILGFSVIFIALGASSSAIGQLLTVNRELIEKLGGLLIIVFGLQMAGLLKLKLLMSPKSWDSGRISKKGWFGSFFLGLAFGSGWSPCVGLALSSILILAGSSQSMAEGIGLLSVYSLGLGMPFVLISLALTYSVGLVKKLNRFLPVLGMTNGWLMVVMGLFLFTGQLQRISAWFSQFSLFTI